ELRLWHFVQMRVQNIFATDISDARTADRPHEGYAGKCQRRGRSHDRKNVGIILKVVLNDGDDDLGVMLVAVGKEWTDRAIDKTRGQRLLLAGAAFTLEEATGDL